MLFVALQACNAKSENSLQADVNSPTATVQHNGNFTEAAKVATPAVVNISTYARLPARDLGPLEQYLRERAEGGGRPVNPAPGEEDLMLSGSGSGVIIDSDGYIITSRHILAHAEKVEITLNDKRVYSAEIVGDDPATDLALLRIDENGLPFLEFGNIDELEVGEQVAAVGNPFNLTSTVTAGIVSAKARDLELLARRTDVEGRTIESYIQTDAAVNPGNSGGALVNMNGQLVGINAAIASPTGVFAGYSFAVPVNIVRKVANDIAEYGEVRRGTLGVSIRDINSRMARENGIDDLSGVYVVDVLAGSPASEAGIQSGDVIMEIDGREVQAASEVMELVSLKRPGEEVNVTYRRGEQTLETEVDLGS